MKSSIVMSVEAGVVPLGLGGDFEENARFIAELGFDGVELLALNLGNIDTERIREITERNGLVVTAVGSGRYYSAHGLSLATNDGEIRKKTMDRVREALGFASKLESHITLGAGQGAFDREYSEGFNHLTECLRECAKTAEELGAMIYIEVCNRYLPTMIRTIREGKRLVDEVSSPMVKLLADTHHMNIEERSLSESIRQAKGYIAYMHFSDSNRLAAGFGHIDYHAIGEALKDIDFQGFATAEFIPEPDQATAARQAMQLMKSLPY